MSAAGATGPLGCIATGQPVFGVSSKGTELVTVDVDVDGSPMTWTGFLSEKTEAKTAEQLGYLGFDPTTGVIKPMLAIAVVEFEPYVNDEGVERQVRRVKWINDANRGPKFEPMAPAQKVAAMDRLRRVALGASTRTAKLPNSMKTPPPEDPDFG